MDRNFSAVKRWAYCNVALRKESVDRNNSLESKQIDPSVVALRKESVDRNKKSKTEKRKLKTSLSARRAWIEMIMETPWRYLI